MKKKMKWALYINVPGMLGIPAIRTMTVEDKNEPDGII